MTRPLAGLSPRDDLDKSDSDPRNVGHTSYREVCVDLRTKPAREKSDCQACVAKTSSATSAVSTVPVKRLFVSKCIHVEPIRHLSHLLIERGFRKHTCERIGEVKHIGNNLDISDDCTKLLIDKFATD